MEIDPSEEINYALREEYLREFPETFSSIRNDHSAIFIEVRYRISQFIASRVHPIEAYRWLIKYIIDLPKKDINAFAIFKVYRYGECKIVTSVANRMKELGIIIEKGSRFGYVVCDVGMHWRIANKAYEIGYFRDSEYLQLDYAYYAQSLVSLEKLLFELGPLPEPFYQLRYQRKSNSKALNLVDNPIEMMAAMMIGKCNLNILLTFFDEITGHILDKEILDMEIVDEWLDSL